MSAAWRRRMPYLALVITFALTIAYIWPALTESSSARTAALPTPSPSPSAHGDGLSDSHDGYLMQPVSMPTTRGAARTVAFRIVAPDGTALTDYETVQTKLLHMYVLRDDLSGYQHVHPELVGDTWSATIGVPDGGSYRVYAEFTPRGRGVLGHPTTLGLAFLIPGDTKLAPLPAPAATSDDGELTLTRMDGVANLLEDRGTLLRFRLTDRSGAVVTGLEPYLGSLGHMSAFDSRTQALSHVHAGLALATAGPIAADGVLGFHVQFTGRGERRLYLEFQVAGKVHRAAFTIFVT
ncbi:hypothetical protein F4553_002475 [Allocatelliglobosispora scoriae]|uniref:Heavy-metal-associated domain-containing protein n=1 Tax=Allocatelliglobosispora scoriae TaxID=643052 RepID=A0A841BP63_9ACTN|nr:hypothetical protein [Allocatelliglobosispora scoriae]MBB5869096.1 hypothetical protein [Allocatelliglobosispora scoriae]